MLSAWLHVIHVFVQGMGDGRGLSSPGRTALAATRGLDVGGPVGGRHAEKTWVYTSPPTSARSNGV